MRVVMLKEPITKPKKKTNNTKINVIGIFVAKTWRQLLTYHWRGKDPVTEQKGSHREIRSLWLFLFLASSL